MVLDQFYTKHDVAEKYYNIVKSKIDINKYDIILEPSAGSGSFFELFDKNKRIGIDIDPKNKNIIKQDFFEYEPVKNKKYIVIGNPPFGKVSSTAVKFFNKSAEFADTICFIIPRTFKRVSVQNKLNLNFHNIYSEDVPLSPCCFEPKMDAKCVFQIWQKTNKKRKKVILNNEHNDFTFRNFTEYDTKNQPIPPTNADFALKAYGSNCGKIKDTELNVLRPKSWHWIKANINIIELKKRFNSLDYTISKDTVRQDSIGRKELIFLYEQNF
jgi:hypothetical protein